MFDTFPTSYNKFNAIFCNCYYTYVNALLQTFNRNEKFNKKYKTVEYRLTMYSSKVKEKKPMQLDKIIPGEKKLQCYNNWRNHQEKCLISQLEQSSYINKMEVRSDHALHIKIIYLLISVNTCLTGVLYLTTRNNCAPSALSDQTINIYKSYVSKLRGKTNRLRRSFIPYKNSVSSQTIIWSLYIICGYHC